MAVTVKLPTILRKHAGNEAKVSAEGATLVEVLKDLESRYPGITKNVIAEDGGLHRFINVYVNDEDVRYLGSLETPVADGDTVSILPAVAGGQGLALDRRSAGSLVQGGVGRLRTGRCSGANGRETLRRTWRAGDLRSGRGSAAEVTRRPDAGAPRPHPRRRRR